MRKEDKEQQKVRAENEKSSLDQKSEFLTSANIDLPQSTFETMSIRQIINLCAELTAKGIVGNELLETVNKILNPQS